MFSSTSRIGRKMFILLVSEYLLENIFLYVSMKFLHSLHIMVFIQGVEDTLVNYHHGEDEIRISGKPFLIEK
jgi:hypothetical protein